MDGKGATTAYGNSTAALYSATFACGAVLLGVMVLVGGASRMSGPSFKYVLGLAPYWVWGCAFCFAGVAAVLGQWRHWKWAVRAGHSVAGTAHLFWVGAFLFAVKAGYEAAAAAKAAGLPEPPKPALTGIAIYLTFGVVHCISAGLLPRWPDHGRR